MFPTTHVRQHVLFFAGSVHVHFINKDEPSLERAWPHLFGAQLQGFWQAFSACQTEGPELNFPTIKKTVAPESSITPQADCVRVLPAVRSFK